MGKKAENRKGGIRIEPFDTVSWVVGWIPIDEVGVAVELGSRSRSGPIEMGRVDVEIAEIQLNGGWSMYKS